MKVLCLNIIDEAINENNEVPLILLSNLYINLQAKCFLSEKTLNTIISSLLDIDQLNKNNLKLILKDNGINDDIINKISNSESLFEKYHNVNDGCLRTTFMRKKFFKENYYFIEPLAIKIDETINDSIYYYVPILETKNKDIFDQCFSDESISNDNVGIYTNITDGKVFKKNDFF